ncbi:transcription factor TFIIIB component B'' homolog isoform X2 [Molossus molossus]|uniref:B double prime 1, subunit of RNA polymerase III transcription initiation factor IIIB n=2 Tax=Molossus molossus TaxID=27622 RepID=A0A7J8IXH0_MOLMO|nr:transcription factor TFIIIB component B'' homolog isoform X2 [Molossus molossus]KAF6488819.1 B double prime 1, subunit of RNA polymerase III transcription initiation factor IIIB [Molossus molossus]
MFRRARLSVKPNVRPGVGARCSTATNSQRGQEAPRPPEPAPACDPKPAEPTDIPSLDFGGAETQKEAPRNSNEKTDGKNDAEESSKSSTTVSQRRKRISSTPTVVKLSVSVPSVPHPLSTVNQEAPQPNPSPTKEKKSCSDRYRIYKAQKLREMLKEELRKEKKQWKNKYAINETQKPADRSKMTMRDFIYYLPDSNPMTSSLEQEKKTEKSLTPVQTREQEDKSTPDVEDNEELEEEMDDGPLLVPRVKVAEDGSIILDEESLTVEVLRTKGPCVVEENDPIFERGSTTTYSSFRKNYYSKPWSNKETDMFFLAISMVGTDFSMIGQLFPHRARIEIKNKFKREEKTNGWRIDKAFQEKRPFDFDFFAHLLQKVLAEEEKRKQKSIKNQSLKEKKSSKPRKNVKVTNVATEGGNDNPDESVSADISDTEESQKDAQTVQEELQTLTLSGQDSEQIVLESDLNRKKKKKHQDEVGKQEVKHLSGNATVQPGPSKGEKQKNTCQSLRPERSEDESNKEQDLSCAQNISEVEDLSSSDKVMEITDPILSSSQQDAISVATETSESSTSDFCSSEVGIRALCEVNNAESSCTEEINVELKNISLETDQTENVKPMVRGRLQRPKPNLSRAVGKKSVLSQGKTDAKSKSLHPETSVEKTLMEKDKTNSYDISGMENTERENSEADTVSNLCEKTNLQEDDQPKAFRPARLMRGRLQRPKPNVGKAAERKEILASQEEIGANVEKNENESCFDTHIPEQIEDQSCKNFESEDATSQSEIKDTSFQNVQADEPKSLSECLSIQEDNKANTLKQVPVLKKRFQKPKPNIGRRMGRRDIFSKEEVSEEVVSGKKTATRLEMSPREKVPVEANITKEMESELKETGRRDISSRENIPEMIDITMEMETGLKETGKEISPRKKIPEVTGATEERETDLGKTERSEIILRESALEDASTVGAVETGLEETGREISPREKVPEVTNAIEEIEIDLEETDRREIPTHEQAPEVRTIGEVETGLKELGREVSPEEEIPEVTGATEETETDLGETGRSEIFLQESTPEEVNTVGEVETGLEETGREISPREKVPEVTGATEGREIDLEETEKREIFTQEKVLEVRTIGEVDTNLKEIFSREKVLAGISAIEEKEIHLKETGKRDISQMEMVSGKMAAIKVTEADLKQTGRKISLGQSGSEEISAVEGMVADLKKTGKIDISLRENEPEETGTSLQTETELMQSGSADCSAVPSVNVKNISSEILSMVHTSVEEAIHSEKEVSSQLSHWKTSSQTSELDKTEDQGTRSAGVPEQFSDINLSKSLPQEQKPFKPAPFMRSRFKRPKPNLSRAALKREIMAAEKHVPGKRLETDEIETGVVQHDGEQMNTLPSQQDASSLMTLREKDKLSHIQEEAGILPCVLTEKNLSPSSSEPKEASQSTQGQEKELLVSMGTYNINTFQEEMKESVIQTTRPIRGRLQKPRPNIKKAGQRQMVEKGEAKGLVKEERVILQKNETEKKFLTVPNSQIGTEIEVVSSKVSEGRTYENQSHVALVENLHVNKINVLDKKMRHEHKTYVSSPAPLIRRQFQKAKPNLGRAHDKKEELGIEKDRAEPSEARKPEDNLLQQGNSDTQLLQKEKAELLTSLEVSTRKDSVGSKEAGLAKKDAQSEVGPSGNIEQKTVGDNSVSSVVEERHLSKPASHSQLLKESNYSKSALNRRTTISSASGCEIDNSERRMRRKIKPNVNKGRGSKRIRSKTSKKEPRASKAMLVTLRASQEEDEDDVEDFESAYEEESYHLAPEEINKAPVFVPVGLRSPEPVSAQIEETMEELEITVNVPDIGFITVDEHHLSNTDVTTQEMQQEENVNVLSVEMTTGEHTQDETDTNDGSTEAAITLLTMGDLVLQSEISTEQSDGVCVLPGVHSKDKGHIPFSPDNVSDKIVHECQELSSPVSRIPLSSLEENKIVLEEQSTKEEIGLTEKVKETTISTRNTTSEVTNNLRIRSRFAKPKPNHKKILGTNRFGAHQEVPSLFVTKGEEVEFQREMEKNTSKATGLEDKNLESVTTAENKEQSRLAHVHGIEETSILQEASLTERKEDQEQGSQEVQILSFAPIVSSGTNSHPLGLGRGLSESSFGEPLRKDSNGDNMLTLYVPECTPASIPEVQQENVINPQDLTVNLVANVHHGGEDEQAFILTLVEIPTNAVEEFTDTATQLMPNPLLPAPILVRSVTAEEKGDMSMNFPVTSFGQDAMCLSNSGSDDSEKAPANLDLMSRKRFHCRPDESDHVPPAKKCSLTSRDDSQKYASEVCSKELINVFEETGKSYKGQDIFPTSEITYITPEPQKQQLEPTFLSAGSRPLDKIIDTHTERNTPQLTQDKAIVSDKEEGTCATSKPEHVDSITSSSKTPLSRPGRRPLGFLSLICSKNSLESDEPTQVHRKKRLKPLIPVSRQNLKRSDPLRESQKKIQESSDLLPSPSVVDTQSENIDSSAAQVSCDRSLLKEECKSVQKQTLEEEPTTVSEYFFSDIFIEVDKTE